MTVDVIIPVYKPGQELAVLLKALNTQSVKAGNIILVNTKKAYFDAFLQTYGADCLPSNVKLFHIAEEEFDHGATRHWATEQSQADYFLCMTQDAIPKDAHLIENLLSYMEGKVAVAYARQLATEDSGILEQVSRRFNYPEESRIKSEKDLEQLGIKTFFCSNVCALYDKAVYHSLGGFVRKTIFNEDMIYASKAIKAGYSIAYAADACVYHSHQYSYRQQFRRNFDLGVSQAQYPEVFASVKSESEGKKLVSYATRELRAQGKAKKLPDFYMQCISKYAGYLLGKHYQKLPQKFIRKCTSNTRYWTE